jgi:hypothetical protein
MNRLDTLSPKLAEQFKLATAAKQYAACVEACNLAIAKSNVKDPIVIECYRKLRAGGSLTSEEKAVIEALSAQLDDEYFTLREDAELGKAVVVEYRDLFAKARAVTALGFVSNGHYAEAIYEAGIAMGNDNQDFIVFVYSMLK